MGKPKIAIDAGSGFGYGTVFLHTVGIRAIGIDKVEHKITQGSNLFKRIGLSIPTISKVDFSQTPAVFDSNFVSLPDDTPKVDLITMFYLSGEMLFNSAVIEKCRALLNKGGKLMMSTHVATAEAREVFSKLAIAPASVAINEIEDNFERTAIIIEFQ